jgi:hypothetical protein
LPLGHFYDEDESDEGEGTHSEYVNVRVDGYPAIGRKK